MSGVCAACGAPYGQQAACPQCGTPDAFMPAAAASPKVREQGRVPENLAAALAYFTVIPAIVLLLTKPYRRNELVRFHAFQCLALGTASAALGILLLLLAGFAGINLLLIPVALIAAIGLALMLLLCVIKAYRRETYALPLVGAWAKKRSSGL